MNLSLNDVIAILTPAMPLLIAASAWLYRFFVSKLPVNQQNTLNGIVSTVVSSVEQQSNAGLISPDARKAQAVALVQAIATRFGGARYASPEVLNALIEAAVFEMNQSKTSAGAGTPPAGVMVA